MAEAARRPVSDPPVTGRPEIQKFFQAYRTLHDVEKLRQKGKLERAEQGCAEILQNYPDYVHALRTMGMILADQSRFEEALGYLHRAAMLNPKDPKILVGLSTIYLRLEAYQTAGLLLEEARARSPKDAAVLVTLGQIYRDQCEYERAKEVCKAALEVKPSYSAAEMVIAQALVDTGDLPEAAEICERYVREGSRSINHLYMLSRFPTSLVTLDVISLLDKTVPHHGGAADDKFQTRVAFTKASAFDKAGRHEEAWGHICEARRSGSVEGRKGYRKYRERQEPLLENARTGEFDLASGAETSADHPLSLFIAGPSRAGKTTLERLVGSLAEVKRGYENRIVENSVGLTFQTAGYPTRKRLVDLPQPLVGMFRSYYIEELCERAESAKVLTNTMPTRSEDALEAAAAIPNARFIFVKRNIEDLSIRIFMKSYRRGNYYAWDLRDIHDHVTWYYRMIDIMAERMPHLCRVIVYEDMAADPAATLAEVAELCGLDASGAEIPDIGDDRGCGAPYRHHIDEALREGI